MGLAGTEQQQQQSLADLDPPGWSGLNAQQRTVYLRSPTASAEGLWQPKETCSWHCLVAIMILLTISGFLGWLAVARIEAKHWVIKGDRFKCSGTEKETKIYSTEEHGEGWRKKPSLPDICTNLKSFPIKFIMNLIQSPMAQRNFLSNKKVLLRDR